jgi:hypothetical protein
VSEKRVHFAPAGTEPKTLCVVLQQSLFVVFIIRIPAKKIFNTPQTLFFLQFGIIVALL